MTLKEIRHTESEIKSFLKDGRLRDAFNALKNVSEGTMNYEVADRIKRIEQNYAYMLNYLKAGADDPHRDILLNDIIAETYESLDFLITALLQPETPTLYYNIRRYSKRNGAGYTVKNGIERWKQARRRSTSLSSLYADAKSDNNSAQLLESAEIDLFNRVWTSFPLTGDDKRSLVEMLTDPDVTTATAMRLTSALSLAVWEFADRQAIEALCDLYQNMSQGESRKEREVTSAALVGLVSALFKYKDKVLFKSTVDRLAALGDLRNWRSDLKILFMEMVRSRDTERINKTMYDKIMPEMMALKPEIEKKIRDTGNAPESFEDLQSNPEWEELLAKSGIEEQLRELNELQMEGSDIFMSTFSHLKNFPFFNEVINWFTPMDGDSVELEKILTSDPEIQNMLTLIEKVPFLCDSDKFSMLFSIKLLPDDQRDLMIGQINAQSEHLEDLKSELSGITDQDHRRADIRNYLRNLYRFLNLFRRKSEFYNIFSKDINLLSVTLLEDDLKDAELLRLIGEFYFKRGYYDDALTAFTALDEMNQFDSTLYQKMGFAYEKAGNLELAAKYYEQADLLDSSSRWLKLKMVNVYKATNRINEAISILKSLLENNDQDIEVELLLGYIYVRQENYREALRRFYKVEFLEDNRTRKSKVSRPIAWSLFMIRDFEKSQKYYETILCENPTGEDYLNMGHVALARSKFKEAINFYKLYILAADNDKESFFNALEVDKPHLISVGINKNTISLIADAMLYELD